MSNSITQLLVNPMHGFYLEHIATPFKARYHLLGSYFHVESNDRRLLQLAANSFAGSPKHRFPGHSHQLKIRLILQDFVAAPRWQTEIIVPELNVFLLDGVSCVTMGTGTISIINSQTGLAQIIVSNQR